MLDESPLRSWPWNASLDPGASTSFGWIASGPGAPSDGYFTARWDAPRDDQFVAGYEVALDGAVVSRVGGATALVRLGFGTHFVSVRAFDGAGNLSTPTQVMISIDPGPSASASSTVPRAARS